MDNQYEVLMCVCMSDDVPVMKSDVEDFISVVVFLRIECTILLNIYTQLITRTEVIHLKIYYNINE